MKITRRQLRQIIKEELTRINEGPVDSETRRQTARIAARTRMSDGSGRLAVQAGRAGASTLYAALTAEGIAGTVAVGFMAAAMSLSAALLISILASEGFEMAGITPSNITIMDDMFDDSVDWDLDSVGDTLKYGAGELEDAAEEFVDDAEDLVDDAKDTYKKYAPSWLGGD